MIKTYSLRIFLCFMICGVLSQSAIAAARSWIGAGAGGTGTVFNTAANWTGSGALLATDDLTMTLSSTATITLNASVTINSFTFNVTGGTTGTLDVVSSVLTMNGPFVCNAVDFFSPPNYSYLRIHVGSAAAGLIFNNNATFHTTGAGTTYIFGPTANPGFLKFYSNVTFGPRCRTAAGVEPDMYFDALVAQTITVNIDPSTTYTMPEDVWYGFVNSPTVTITGSNPTFFFGSYNGNVRIKNAAIVKPNLCTLDGFSAVLDFYMDPGSKLEISSTNDFPQGGYNNYFLDVASTVEYLGAGTAQTVTGTTVASLAYGNLIIGGSGNKTAGSGTITKGDFLIRAGATFLSSSFIHQNKGNFANDGTFTAGTSTHNFTGTAMQYINGAVLPVFYKLSITNTSTGVTLNRQVNVSNLLTLTDGIVYTSAGNFLEVTSTGSSTTGSDASHVDGPMRKTGTTAFVFPVGDAGIWARIGFSAPASSNTFEAIYYFTCSPSYTIVNAPLLYASQVEYWTLDRVAGTAAADVTLYWENNVRSGITIGTGTDLRVARWNGTSWEDKGHVTDAGTTPTGWVKGTSCPSFSPFSFASISAPATNPLPIELTTFRANINSGKVDIAWVTASEANNDYFTVEKSKDGQNFEQVSIVKGAGNSLSQIEYFDVDYFPYTGMSYYRLKQTDYDGNFTYSNVVPVENNLVDDATVSVFPNPAPEGSVTHMSIHDLKGKEVLVVLRDLTGKEIFSKVVVSETDNEIVVLDQLGKLAKGSYLVTASSANKLYSKKLLVK